MTLKEIDARKNELKEILRQENEVIRLKELKKPAKKTGASAARFRGTLSEEYQSPNIITEGEIVHNIQETLQTETMIEMSRISAQNFWIAVIASMVAVISVLINFLSMLATWIAALVK